MIKVVYIVPYLIKAGPINVLYEIVKHLDRSKVCPVIVTLQKNSAPSRDNKDWFQKLNIEIVENAFSFWYMQFHLSDIAQLLKHQFQDDNIIFHAHGYYPTLIVSKIKGARKMTTVHNICGQDFVMEKGALMGNYMSYMYKRALKRLDVCVPICDFMKNYYSSKLNLKAVYNGVSPTEVYTAQEREVARKALGIDSHVKVLICPAAFSVCKNQKFIIEGVLSSQRKDILVLFAGKGDTQETCKELTRGDERFRFLGYQMDMEPFWKAADFMISASQSEGFGLVVAEAMMRGLPCILSDIPAYHEIVQKVTGNTNLCFSLENKSFLIDILNHKLDTSCDRELIHQKTNALYSSQVMSDGYSDIYSSFGK